MFVQRFLRIISSWLAALTSDLRDMSASYLLTKLASLHSFSDDFFFFCLSNGS